MTTVNNKENIYIFTDAKADKIRQCTNVKENHYYKATYYDENQTKLDVQKTVKRTENIHVDAPTMKVCYQNV